MPSVGAEKAGNVVLQCGVHMACVFALFPRCLHLEVSDPM